MFKNIIIVTLLYMVIFNVSVNEFFNSVKKGLDKTQEIVYDIQRSVK